MIVTILEVGKVPERIRDDFASYPVMFTELLKAADPTLGFETIAILDGADFPDPKTLEAVLITGSPFGVYDDTPWMLSLMSFIRQADAAGVPQVGICFGHQAIAKALGGDVDKSDKGWGIGRHAYHVVTTAEWMGETPPTTAAMAVSHQDQVLQPPPDAQVILASDFTPYAGLAYEGGYAISFQGHPEFSDAYSAALYQNRQGNPLTPDAVQAAKKSLETPEDNALVAAWIARFLRDAAKSA
jgi:GMP synthase-like glutamine amidotransferase